MLKRFCQGGKVDVTGETPWRNDILLTGQGWKRKSISILKGTVTV